MSTSTQSEENSAETKEIIGTYRILGVEDDGSRFLLYDTERGAAIRARRQGYENPLQSRINDLQCGNQVTATIEGVPSQETVWTINTIERDSDTKLAFVKTADFVPGKPDRPLVKSEDDDTYGLGILEDDKSGDILMEMHIHPDTVDGADIWEGMRRGTVSLEPWFDELEETVAGAKVIYVVHPVQTDYVALLCFPSEGEIVRSVHDEITDYYAEHDDLTSAWLFDTETGQ